MKTVKLCIGLIAVFIFSLAFSSRTHENVENGMSKGAHKLKPHYDSTGHKWKVDKVKDAEKGEQVIFERDPVHDLYFQFPEGLFEEPPLSGTTEVLLSISHGGETDLTKTVKSTKSKYEYTYAIFIPDLHVFVESDSPPTIIIK